MNGPALTIVRERPTFGQSRSVTSARPVGKALVGPVIMSRVPVVKKNRAFDPRSFLATIGEGRKLLAFPKGQTI
jgi:hypothetical protein